MVSQWMGRAFGNKGRFGHKREGPVFFTSFVIFVFEHFMAHKQVRFLSMNLYVSLYIYCICVNYYLSIVGVSVRGHVKLHNSAQ